MKATKSSGQVAKSDFCHCPTRARGSRFDSASITDVKPKKAFTMGNNIDYKKWNYKLRFQVKKIRAERDRLSDEIFLLQSKNEILKTELSENKIYTSKQVLEMMSEQAKIISNYAKMFSDLAKENFELKRQKTQPEI